MYSRAPHCLTLSNCSSQQAVLERRLLERGKTSGRIDDNLESIKKRFKVFMEQSLPVVSHYASLGKCVRINTDAKVDDIYFEVRTSLLSTCPQLALAGNPATTSSYLWSLLPK